MTNTKERVCEKQIKTHSDHKKNEKHELLNDALGLKAIQLDAVNDSCQEL